MKGKKILKFILCFTFLLSATLNLYFLIPHKVSESVSTGNYLSTDASNGKVYRLSIMQDNKVLLYGPKDDLFEGKLEFLEKENCYLIKTESNIYQVMASDDTISLPIIENGRIISKLFKKVHDPLPKASLD